MLNSSVKPFSIKEAPQHMAISELSFFSGMPISTIKYYLRKALLPKPIKTGQTKAYYTPKHLKRLRLIQKIKKEGKVSLNGIKAITSIIDEESQSDSAGSFLSSEGQRDRIIEAAIANFREKGYDVTTITDIIKAIGVGRSTFYKHFKNKKEVFLVSIETLLSREPSRVGIDEDADQQNILELFNKHADALYKVTPLWRDIMSLLRSATITDPDEFSEMLDEVIHLKINLYKKRIQKGIQSGILRNVNHHVLAVMIMGIQEYCSQFLLNKSMGETGNETLLKEVKDILLYGILNKSKLPS